MTEFLLLTLYAPLASWGDIAVGEERGSWDRPSRSAVLGLLGAALRLTRDDQAAHDALDTGYGIGVRLDTAGSPLTDYHTAQTVSESSLKAFAKTLSKPRGSLTRAEQLAAADLETILSRRMYRQDALATVAIWARVGARWPLTTMASELERPGFVLYAGRKGNAFGLPLAPQVVPAATLADAFHARPLVPRGLGEMPSSLRRALAPGAREVSHDPCDAFESGLALQRREQRRDARPQRSRWQFAQRTVEVSVLADPASGGSARGASANGDQT